MTLDRTFDLLVIGGGINGAGIARDAAGRGLSVLLCERDDLASGTSSASSGLIHGGLRYLEQGALRLVRESLAERETLGRIAPHIVRPLRFVLPHDPALRPAWRLRLGLMLYDRLGGGGALPGSGALDLRTLAGASGLRPGLEHGFQYWDCQVADARLAVLTAVDAQDRGAVLLTRTPCTAARREEGFWRVRLGAREVWARILVNAAGPWAGQVLSGVLGRAGPAPLRLVKGSHILVPRLYPGHHGVLLQNPDRRVVFLLPCEGALTLIGTTDVAFTGDPATAAASAEEIDYLCTAASRWLARPVRPHEVVGSFAGVRPLHDDHRRNPARISRDYVLELDAPPGAAPLLNVFGGKLTTYRTLAERALERLADFLPDLPEPWTGREPLPGGDLPDRDPAAFAAGLERRHPWLPSGLALRLAHTYGTRALALIGDAARPADLGRDFGAGLREREVCWLIEHELAATAADILTRRTRLGRFLRPEQHRALEAWLERR